MVGGLFGEEGMVKGEGKGRVNMVEYFICSYESRMMKPVKIILKVEKR
jgi:hypothetical protein